MSEYVWVVHSEDIGIEVFSSREEALNRAMNTWDFVKPETKHYEYDDSYVVHFNIGGDEYFIDVEKFKVR